MVPMSKYRVYFRRVTEGFAEVEADSPMEAEDKFYFGDYEEMNADYVTEDVESVEEIV